MKVVREPPGQRNSNESKEIVTESKDNYRISSGGITWCKMGDLGGRAELDYIIGFEVELTGEWWK